MELPKYRCHKVVEAAKIVGFTDTGQDVILPMVMVGTSVITIWTRQGWRSRYKGSEEDYGYFVRYEDGYESWSPSKAFEEGYTPFKEDATISGFGAYQQTKEFTVAADFVRVDDRCMTPEHLEDAGIIRKPNPRAGLRPVEVSKRVIGEDQKLCKVPYGKGYFHRFAQWCNEGEAEAVAVVERPNGEIVELAADCVRFTDVEAAND